MTPAIELTPERPVWFDSDADREFIAELAKKIRPEIQRGEELAREQKKPLEEIHDVRYRSACTLFNRIDTMRKVAQAFKQHPDKTLAVLAQEMGIGPADDDSPEKTAARLDALLGKIDPSSTQEFRKTTAYLDQLRGREETPEDRQKRRVDKLKFLCEHCGLTPEDFRSYGLGKEMLLRSKVTGPILQELFDMRESEKSGGENEQRKTD